MTFWRSFVYQLVVFASVLAGLLLLQSYHPLSIGPELHAIRRLRASRQLENSLWSKKKETSFAERLTASLLDLASKKSSNAESANQISLVYVIGVDGSGYSDVASAIATIGKTCNQYTVTKNPSLQSSRTNKRSAGVQSFLTLSKFAVHGSKEVLIIDEQSFPSEGLLVNTTSLKKRRNGAYDIGWLHHQATLANITLKIVYVNRDIYQAAALSASKDALATAVEFAQYINEEHSIVSAKQIDVWTQVSYESFAHMRNCTALVSAVADFMQWSACDVEFACATLQSAFNSSVLSGRIVDAGHGSNALVLPSIPLLDISGTKQHSVKTFVSNKVPILSAGTVPTKRKSKGVLPHKDYVRPPVRDILMNFTGKVINNLSYLYIVGVEGTGHHGVTPAIAAIAKTCNYHVLYESSVLRRSWQSGLPNRFKSSLEGYKRHKIQDTNKVIVIEDASFPTSQLLRVSSAEEKKNASSYNLEWLYDQTAAVGVDMKFLHLTRDFYRAVASHPEFDNGFEPHARVLHDFLQHIHGEFKLIDGRAPGRWREVQYESFTQMHNCTALVSAVVEFMQWDDCDIDFACEMITSTVRTSSKNRTIDAQHLAHAQTLNTTLTIPLLDLTPREYNFTTVVSERKPFTFIANMTTRVKAAHVARFSSRNRNTSQSALHVPFPTSARVSNNNVSFLYVVGVDGSGHSEVSVALAKLAQSCKYQVIYKPKPLWRAQSKLLPRTYFHTLGSIAHSVYKDTSKVLVMEDTPMAAGETFLGSSSAAKRKLGKNNLSWVHERLVEYKQLRSARFLYLHRPAAEIVHTVHNVLYAVGNKSALSVLKHGELVSEYTEYLFEEYARISAIDNATWAQAPYEWFERSVDSGDATDTSSGSTSTSCMALVNGIIGFTGWSDCDIVEACTKLSALKFPKLPSDRSKYAALEGLNTTLPIPFITYL